MPKEILIDASASPQEKRAAIINNERLEEFHIERPQDKTIVGNIYKGKIEAVLPSIGAAFVDIGLSKNGFLYLSDIEDSLELSDIQELPSKEISGVRSKAPEMNSAVKAAASCREAKKGQEVLVQVVKESFGTKGPRLSCQIGLAGRYLVLMPQDTGVGVSRRIEDDEERRRLRQMFSEFKLPKNAGFIVRTAAAGKSKQELLRDANFLLKLWKRIERIIQGKKAPSLIYEEYDLTFRAIRDSFTDDVSKLIVNSKPEYYRIQRFMNTFLRYLTGKVELYKGDDLFEDKGVERQVNRIFENKVYLKSKAYIIIEPTEGLVVIDVNSGGFKKKTGQEETAFKVNCEAAEEIAHQLKLRDLGGIIVVDFIDMSREAHRREVLNILKKALSNDRAKYDILGISKFGVVEMTRERIHNTVQTLSYEPCPYCQGRGRIRSAITVSIFVVKKLKRFLKDKPQKQVNVTLNPEVIVQVLKDKATLSSLEQKFKAKINFISNPSAHIEDITIS